jgi:hypothetical protein
VWLRGVTEPENEMVGEGLDDSESEPEGDGDAPTLSDAEGEFEKLGGSDCDAASLGTTTEGSALEDGSKGAVNDGVGVVVGVADATGRKLRLLVRDGEKDKLEVGLQPTRTAFSKVPRKGPCSTQATPDGSRARAAMACPMPSTG